MSRRPRADSPLEAVLLEARLAGAIAEAAPTRHGHYKIRVTLTGPDGRSRGATIVCAGTPGDRRAADNMAAFTRRTVRRLTRGDEAMTDQVFRDPSEKHADCWRVAFADRIEPARFNSRGAALAYLDALVRGVRRPEAS